MSHMLRPLSSPHTLICHTAALLLFALGGPLACRDDDTSPDRDDMSSSTADMTGDASMQQDATMADMADMGSDQDLLPLDQGDDADMSEPLDAPQDLSSSDMMDMEDMRPTCEGECATHDLTIAFGATTRSLGRAVYGLSSPEQSVNGEGWEIYVEGLQGGFAGCPEELSDAPDYTFILNGLPILTGGEVLSKETHQLNAILFDYEGDLVPDPPFRTVATEVRVTARTTSVCTDCVGAMGEDDMGSSNSDPGGFVSLEVEAVFPEGVISGTLYAEHCDSLDAR